MDLCVLGVCSRREGTEGVDGGAGRSSWMLKDHREHRSTFGETEAQPSKGVHAAHRDLSPSLSPCQDTRAEDELLGHGTSPCSSCTPQLQDIPGTELPWGTPGRDCPCPGSPGELGCWLSSGGCLQCQRLAASPGTAVAGSAPVPIVLLREQGWGKGHVLASAWDQGHHGHPEQGQQG